MKRGRLASQALVAVVLAAAVCAPAAARTLDEIRSLGEISRCAHPDALPHASEKGEAPAFVRAHDMTVGGSFPINTSGGQLSVGQAGAAGGMLGLVEAIRQLTGEVLGGQVPDAKLGLVSGFGMINYDRGLCSGAVILASRDA